MTSTTEDSREMYARPRVLSKSTYIHDKNTDGKYWKHNPRGDRARIEIRSFIGDMCVVCKWNCQRDRISICASEDGFHFFFVARDNGGLTSVWVGIRCGNR